MNSSTIQMPDAQNAKNARRHKHIRQLGWAAIIFAAAAFPPALYYYSLATIACWGDTVSEVRCGLYKDLSWMAGLTAIGLYIAILCILHELGYEGHEGYAQYATGDDDQEERRSQAKPPIGRVRWQHVRNGYANLRDGYHRHVRRAHRVSSVVLSGAAAYLSFQYVDPPTLVTLGLALSTYVVAGEFMNWKKTPAI